MNSKITLLILSVFVLFGCNNSTEQEYKDLGSKIAFSTKAQLAKNLLYAIEKNGTEKAISFCNEKAYAITDSMSRTHNSIIRRVSDKPRNPGNNANSIELDHIIKFKQMIEGNKKIEPIIDESSDMVNFYYPIITNSMCLQCHGKPIEDIQAETMKTLYKLYPKDKATGYDINQVRGIWSISLNK